MRVRDPREPGLDLLAPAERRRGEEIQRRAGVEQRVDDPAVTAVERRHDRRLAVRRATGRQRRVARQQRPTVAWSPALHASRNSRTRVP